MALVIMLVHTYYGFTAIGRPRRRRRGRRPRGAHLADRRGVRHGADLAGHLRPVRQLQPVGLDGMDDEEHVGLHPAWWTAILVAFAGRRGRG